MNSPREAHTLPLSHSPGFIESYPVRNGNQCMHVALNLRAGYLTTAIYVTADEARALADQLTQCATDYDRNQRSKSA